MKWKLDYSICLTYSMSQIQAIQGNIHSTLTIQKVVLALKTDFADYFFLRTSQTPAQNV